MRTEVLAIIPARGGSKGIPRKNIRLLAGKPLIAYSIETALKSRYIDRIIVSTEDEEIAKIAKIYGAEVIKRPKELARDETPTIDAVKHVLEFLKKKENYIPDIIILLQPTSPLRSVEDIDNAVELFLNNDCEGIISLCEAKSPPYWSFRIRKRYIEPILGWDFLHKRRQDVPKSYAPNGAIYITTVKNLYRYNGFLSKKTMAYIMPFERSIDIDEEIDFKFAEFLLGEKT